MNQYLKCPTCGKDVTEEDTYCFNCGATLNLNKPQPTSTPKTKVKRRRDLAIGLAILFGGFGVHNFYLAHYKRFAIQLAITIVSFGVFYFLVYGYALFEAFVLIKSPFYLDGNGETLL